MKNRGKISIFLIVTILLSVLTCTAYADSNERAIETSAKYDVATIDKLVSKTNVMDLKAKSAVLIDAASGKILLEKNSHEKLAIASVTKIMSMLLIMEAIDSGRLSFDDRVSVSEYAAGMGGSQAYLKPGEEFSVTEMLNALAIHSSNDVTVSMAEKISGSEETFVADMNQKATELGMNDTKFLDCTGLNDDGYSSAHDVALMSRELLTKHPKIVEFTGKYHDTFRNGTFSLDNTNKLVRFYQNADGLKTGFTNKAGFNLSATANRNGLRLISVVLGEPDSNTRFAESRKLLDFGFANFEVIKMDQKGNLVGNIEVKKGMQLRVGAMYGNDTSVLVTKGEKGKIEREIALSPGLEAPIAMNQKVGEVIYKLDGTEIGRYELVASQDVKKVSFLSLFNRMLVKWFSVNRE